MKHSRSFAFSAIGLTALGVFNWVTARTPIDVSPIASDTVAMTVNEADTAGEPVLREVKLIEAHARPLFSPDRRPWTAPPAAEIPSPSMLPDLLPAPEAVEVAQPAPPPALTLLGVQKTPAGAMALVTPNTGAAPVWLKAGEKYEDWQIDEITATSVQLTNGNGKFTLEMYPTLPGGARSP